MKTNEISREQEIKMNRRIVAWAKRNISDKCEQTRKEAAHILKLESLGHYPQN